MKLVVTYFLFTIFCFPQTILDMDRSSGPVNSVVPVGGGDPVEGTGNVFVDNSATGLNDGTSWTNAYESFASITWSTVDAGDTVYVSGGASAKTYNETMTITASNGTQASRITITNGISPDHDGVVTVDGQSTRGTGFTISGNTYDYITITDFTIVNTTDKGIEVDYADGITLNNITLTGLTDNGINVEAADSATISNCFMTTVGSSANQTDCIVFKNVCRDIIVEYNEIYQVNSHVTPHNDIMQTYGSPGNGTINGTIRYNKFFAWTTDPTNTQIIILEDADGDWYIYNNLFEAGDTCKAHTNIKEATAGAYFNLSNNTYIAGTDIGGAMVRLNILSGTAYIALRNNIISASSSEANFNLVSYSGAGTVSDTSDYNIWYSPNKAGAWDGSSWSSWTTGGNDGNGYNTNPSLDANWKPDSGADPSVDTGTTIGHYSDDLDGVTRSTWDIGAYEYIP